jgi:hypothetical protein
MKKVTKQEIFEITINTPDLYTRYEFNDGESYWVTRFGVKHEEFQEYLEGLYQSEKAKKG